MIKTRTIKVSMTKLDTIFHISDVHIRNFKRHKEYRRVFEKTKDFIKSQNKKNSLIFVTGDIVHSKTDVSPELVQEVQQFFKILLEAGEVVVTAGNHDANLNNNHRLDTLTPIINAINSDRIHYLKDTGIYKIADKHVFVWSVFDEKSKYPNSLEVDCDYKIATYHGPVTNAVTEAGFRLSSENISVSDFEGFDIVLLGDIHKTQYLNPQKTIAYPGSLIQQNHAESIDHGILIWDLESRSCIFEKIDNDTCYYTINVDHGIAEEIPKDLPKNMYLRIRHKNTTQSQIKEILSKVKDTYNIVESSIQRVNDINDVSFSDRKLNVIDVRDVDYQNKAISNYLKEKYSLSEDQTRQICEINKTINKNIVKSDKCRNVIWSPKIFEFDNMFSYGKGNVIDFKNMQGVYGIFAANASGKSTLLDSIMYCLFDKCSKTHKGVQVMNNQSNTFRCKLVFELDGKEYTIERKATRQKNGNVKVDVDFFTKNEDNTILSLNGKERSDTNANIRNVIGSYEDFSLTSLSAQNNNTGFIDMNQKDRKDLLSQFLDISVFEELYNQASSEIKEVSILIKEYQKENYFDCLSICDNEIKDAQEEILKLKEEKLDKESVKYKVNDDIINSSSKVVQIDETIVRVEDLQNKEKKILDHIKSLKTEISEDSGSLCVIANKVSEIESSLLEYDKNSLVSQVEAWKNYVKQFSTLKNGLKISEVELQHKQDKLSKLKDLKYDPNCNFCMENIFVKDAIQISSSFCESLKDVENKKDSLKKMELVVSESSKYATDLETYQKLEDHKKDLTISQINTKMAIQKKEAKVIEAKNLLMEVQKKISEHYEQERFIEQNKEIKIKIDELKIQLKQLETSIERINDRLLEVQTKKKTAEITKQKCEESIKKYKDLEYKLKNYQYYLDATHRDGVPHSIISSVIPKIEEEINNILNQLVEFNVILQTDDKNINAYIAYDDKRFWPIELTSGMEKFVASLAIRTSLINISTLPRPNFIAIDEGFGSLSSENLGSMTLFFDYLKTQFKFIIVVSHIESMRDMVDKHLEIHKFNGRSKIEQLG